MDFLVNKAGEQLGNYMNCNEKLASLKRKLEELNCLREDVESRKLVELRLGKKLKKQVENWFGRVEKISGEVEHLEEEAEARNSLLGGFLGRKVLKIKEEVEELIQGGSFADGLVVDEPIRLGQMLATANIIGDAVKQKLNKILEFLMDDTTGKIGVCGMGGVGKTTIIKEVNNQILKRNDIFDTVIWVTVSKEMDIVKLQNSIAKQLKIDHFEEEDETIRAGILCEVLAKKRRYLIILDDLWDSLSLEEVGLPEPSNGSKIVITTRSLDVCRSMDLKVVEVKPLSKDDAWNLFLEKVGRDILNHGLESIAKLVAAQCAGLPLAIITTASSMKGRYAPGEWRNALNELEKHVETVHQNDEKIFQRLRFSYDCLKDSRVQNCFLYCALYPEDCKIYKGELVMCWIREGLMDEMDSMQAKLDRGHVILNKLISNCLIENCDQVELVKMHDLVRDMALRIKHLRFLVKPQTGLYELPDEEEWTGNLEKVSLMNNAISDLSLKISGQKCQMLTTLLLSRNHIGNIPHSFLEQMPKLKVLDLSWNPITSLPNSITKLIYLTSLLLRGCTNLEKFPSFSNLQALKHLDLYSTNMKEIPEGLQMLINLIDLDLRSKTKSLEIPNGIFTELSHLQHLYLHGSSPVLKEIIGLRRLEFFVGWFDNICDFNAFAFAKRKMCLQGIGAFKYHIEVHLRGNSSNVHKRRNFHRVGALQTKETNTIQIEDLDIRGFIMVPNDVQELMVDHCKATSLNDIYCLEDAFDLRKCKISGCKGMESVFSRWCPQLLSLYYLKLDNLQDLKALLGTESIGLSVHPVDIFPCLKSISIKACGRIKKLFRLGWLQYGLQNLEEIHVEDCEEIEEIIESSGQQDDASPILGTESIGLSVHPVDIFPCLKSISIKACGRIKKLFRLGWLQHGLQNLEEIHVEDCEEIEEIMESSGQQDNASPFQFSLPKLRKLYLHKLLQLKRICSKNVEMICNSLQEVDIQSCGTMKVLFTTHPLLHGFQNLEKISVRGCHKMEEILESDCETVELDITKPMELSLPKLRKLDLSSLPELRNICSTKRSLACNSLEEIRICYCPKLTRLPLFLPQLDDGQPTPPSTLQKIYIYPREWMDSADWNHPSAKDVLRDLIKFESSGTERNLLHRTS